MSCFLAAYKDMFLSQKYVPYFLERAPGALIKNSDFLGGRFYEVGPLSRGGG